jgi:hypothetical protein
MPVASPYAIFRATDRATERATDHATDRATHLTWVSAPSPAPLLTSPNQQAPAPRRAGPARNRRATLAAGLVQGELFAYALGGRQFWPAQAADCP